MPFNLDRSFTGAEAALKAYAAAMGYREGDVEDLLCDLCHLMESRGLNITAALRDAETNWRDERTAPAVPLEGGKL